MNRRVHLLITIVLMCIPGFALAQPAPPTITGSSSFCEGTTITLTASSPATSPTFTWTGPGISGSYSGATLNLPNATVSMTGTYSVTVTSGGQTSAASTKKITIIQKPLPPYLPTPVYTYCQYDVPTLLAATGVNMLWYTTATGGVGSATTPTPSTNVPGTTYYYVTQTVNGCESNRDTITVNVKAKPAPPAVNAVTYCQDDPAYPLSAGGANLLWYTAPSGGIGSPVAPTPLTTYADTNYYYVTQTVNGCESDRSQIRVVVNYKPNAIIVGSQPYVCQHDTMSFIYYGNGTPDATYDWTLPTGASIVGGAGQGPLVVRFDTSGRMVMSLTVDNHGCRSPLTKYTVDVRKAPIVPVNVNKDVCQGQTLSVSLGYANEHIDNYVWDFDGANVIYGANGGGPYGLQWDIPGMHVVKLTVYSNNCPSETSTDTVNVHPIPDAHIQKASDYNICAGDSVSFTAERYNPAYLYQWLPAGYFTNITNQGMVYGHIVQSGYVKLQVTTEYGCTATDSMLITAQPCCTMYFPNAFTPNGDGRNDVFRPIGKGNNEVKTFRIVDRWGQVMYETTDIRQGWDGTHAGTPQDMGTYYYYIRYVCANGRIYEDKGELLLIR